MPESTTSEPCCDRCGRILPCTGACAHCEPATPDTTEQEAGVDA